MNDHHNRERQDAFNARWNAGDGTPHSNFIIKMFRYANRRTDVDLVEMYVDKLSHIPLEELEVVWESMQDPNKAQPIVPGIEAIKKAHTARKRIQREKRTEREKRNQRVAAGEKITAKQACNSAFAARIVRSLNVGVTPTEHVYTGDFDYQAVADAVLLPTKETVDHAPYWHRLWERFEEEWQRYAS